MSAATIQRLPGWDARLRTLIEQRSLASWSWGDFDCVTFAADAMVAVCGQDPLAGLRGSWHDEATAQTAMCARGGLYRKARGVLGRPIALERAWRGDIGAIRTAKGLAMVVFCSEGLIGPGASGGLQIVRRSLAAVAWGVGHA